MAYSKDVRWRQRFENFDRSFNLLNKYANDKIETELERAGLIQFFEMSFELSWKVLKGYLEAEGFVVKRSEEHTSELQSRFDLVCRLLLEKKKKKTQYYSIEID